MAIQITGGCCNCGRLCSTDYDHPVPRNPLVVCSTKCAEEHNQNVRKKKLDKLIRESRKGNFWKSIKSFLSLSR
jgi:hypothetical protein